MPNAKNARDARSEDIRNWLLSCLVSAIFIVVGLAGGRWAVHSRPMILQDKKHEFLGISNRLYQKALEAEEEKGYGSTATAARMAELRLAEKQAKKQWETAKKNELSEEKQKSLRQIHRKARGAILIYEKSLIAEILEREDLEQYNKSAWRYKRMHAKYLDLKNDPTFANSMGAWLLAWAFGFLCGIILWAGIFGVAFFGIAYGFILLAEMP